MFGRPQQHLDFSSKPRSYNFLNKDCMVWDLCLVSFYSNFNKYIACYFLFLALKVRFARNYSIRCVLKVKLLVVMMVIYLNQSLVVDLRLVTQKNVEL